MKLIDMLVDAGLNGWKWPDGTIAITQDKDKAINQYATADGLETNEHGTWKYSASWQTYLRLSHEELCLASDWAAAIITREQYEAALDAKNEGWIEWSGGECPVPGDTEVLIKCKSEGTWDYRHKQRAGGVSWTHDDSALDVIAYRLHQPQQADKVRAAAWNAYAGIAEVSGDKADLNECISQMSAPVWNGEGLPPVGVECEWQDNNTKQWIPVKVVYSSEWVAVVREINEERGDDLVEVAIENYGNDSRLKFRPLRTEVERKRDEVRKAIYAAMDIVDGDIADAIYDAISAGKIPGVKLEGL